MAEAVNEIMVKASGIRKAYGSLNVLKGIEMEVKKGEVISIVGASGAGKSTLLHILGTLDTPDAGKLAIGNETISSKSSKELASFRNQSIGFVFQFHNLLPELDACENIALPMLIAGHSRDIANKRAVELLKLLGLGGRIKHLPAQLSGGEQQRVAIGRALVNHPKLLLADEPTGNLDPQTSDEIMQLLFQICRDSNTTIVMATHDYMVINKFPARTVKTEDGKVWDNATISMT